MSLIFFEGFNRTLDPDYWTVEPSGAYSPAISTNNYRTGATSLLFVDTNNYNVSGGQATLSISPITGTKVYIGFAIDPFGTQFSYYTNGVNGAKRKYFAMYDGSGNEMFAVSAFTINGNLTVCLSLPTFPALHFAAFLVDSTTDTADTYITSYFAAREMQNWNYLEFELDLVGNTIAVCRNGQPLYPYDGSAVSATPTIIAPFTMDSFAQIRFYGSANSYCIEDMYIADATGTTANTWLGPDTRVYSPIFILADTPAEWANGTNAAVINSDNNDVSYISTNVINKVNVYDTGVSPSPADAIVGGVKMTSVARKVTLDSSYRHVYKHTDGNIYNLSQNFDLTTTSYTRHSEFAITNPATSTAWTLTDLDSGKFGVKSTQYLASTGGDAVITIDTQPANQTPTPNNANSYTAMFAVSASVTEGATLSYQWQKAESGSAVFTNISGARSAALSRLSLSYPADNGDQFRVVVSATGGAANVTSTAATLTIPPITVPNPPTNVQGTSGNTTIALTWTAPAYNGGSAITNYKVSKSDDAGASWDAGTLTGSTSTTFTATGLENDTGYLFKVAAVNAEGTGDYSAPSPTLTPIGIPLVITTQPANAYISGVASADFTVAATGAGVTYQWEAKYWSWDAGDFVWADIAGETATTLTLTGNKLYSLGIMAQYDPLVVVPLRCRVTDMGSTTQTTKIARLVNMSSYYPSPYMYTNGGGLTYNPGETIGGVSYDQYTPDAGAVSAGLHFSLSDYTLAPIDYSWFSGNEISIEVQESTDATTWTTISTVTTGHAFAAEYDISSAVGTRYYRWLLKYLWPRTVIDTGTNSAANSTQSDYVFPTSGYKINWPAAPAAPTNVVGYPDASQVVLSWTPPTNNGGLNITGYNIQTSTNGTSWSPWGGNPVSGTGANITGLTNGTPYYFRVAAINSIGAGTDSAASAAVTPAVLTAAADPYFSSVSLLAHFDSGAVTTDNSAYNNTLIAYGTPAAAASTVASRFGGAALRLFAPSEQYISVVPAGGSSALDMSAGDFTLEFWTYCSTAGTGYPTYLGSASGSYGYNAFSIRYNDGWNGNNDKFAFYWNAEGDALAVSTSNTYSPNRWRHVAVVRQGTTVRLYIDGVQDGTMTVDSGRTLNLTDGGSLKVGAGYAEDANAYVTDYIDELRVTKGVCRYPSGTTFTPSAVPFANVGVPGAPTNLVLTTGNASVSLTWTAPTFTGNLSLTDYVVQFSTNGTSWSTFTDGVSTATSATVTGLLNGTTYYFRVAAKNSAGTGDPTAASSGVTPISSDPFYGSNTAWDAVGFPAGQVGSVSAKFSKTSAAYPASLAYQGMSIKVTVAGTVHITASNIATDDEYLYIYNGATKVLNENGGNNGTLVNNVNLNFAAAQNAVISISSSGGQNIEFTNLQIWWTAS